MISTGRWYSCLSLILLLAAAPVSAQHLNFRSYGPRDGLPQQTVNTLFQDDKGYIWFGTVSGACRYNGSKYEVYDISDGLRNSSVMDIAQGPDGRMYLATLGGGLSVLDGEKITNYFSGNGLMSDNAVELLVEDTGAVWVVCTNTLTRMSHGEIDHFDARHGLEARYYVSVFRSSSGDLWVGTSAGLFLKSGETFLPKPLSGDCAEPIVASISEDLSLNLWVGTDRGVYELRENEPEFSRMFEGEFDGVAYSIVEDTRGSIWFGTEEGAYRYAEGGLKKVTTKNGLCSDLIQDILVDREGNVWFGTYNGVSKLRQGAFVYFDAASGLSSDRVTAVFEDGRKRLWVGTAGGGITIFEDERMRQLGEAEGLIPPNVTSIIEAPEGRILISTIDYVYTWDGESFKALEQFPRGCALFRDSRGRIWAASISQIVVMQDDRFEPLPQDNPLSQTGARCLAEDHRGHIWFGTLTKGCLVLDGSKVEILGKREGLSNQAIWSIDVDPGGRVWIGTNGEGAFCYDGVDFKNYTTDDGLSNNYVWQVLADSKGRLWFGTNRGVDLFDGRSFRNFTVDDGLAYNEGVNDRCLEDSRGRIWFVTDKGLSMLAEEGFTANKIPPFVHIEGVMVSGKAIHREQATPFESSANNLSIDFVGISYNDEEDVRYSYKLEGLEEHWSPITRERVINYASVPAGDYLFKVKARNGDGVWSAEAATFRFSIPSPFWATWWFGLTALMFASACIVALHLWRMSRIERKNEVLEARVRERTKELDLVNRELRAFTYSVSHDLSTPLRTIGGFTEILNAECVGILNRKYTSYLERILAAVSKMDRLISDLLRLANVADRDISQDSIDLSLLVRSVANRMRSENPERDVVFDIAAGVRARGDIRLLEIAFENLLGNAWKFTGKRDKARIEFGAEEINGARVYFVRDNGVGFDMTQADKLFSPFQRLHSEKEFGGTGVGLATVQRIINRHGGRIWADAEKDRGATFYFTLDERPDFYTSLVDHLPTAS